MKQTKVRLARSIACLGALLLAQPASATSAPEQAKDAQAAPQAAASPSPAPPRYEETVEVEGRLTLPQTAGTATKMAVPLEKLPVSISAVSSPVLQAQDARYLGDALRNVPGVNAMTGFGVFDYFTIRGFDSLSSSLILTDGAAEPESTFYPMYNVNRVEVMRGPGAYLYGGNPLSGTVNMIRKQPAQGRFADLRFSGGSFSNFEGTLDGHYAPEGGRSAYRVNALFQDADNYRDDKASRIFAVNPAATWRLGEHTPLSVNLELVDSSFKPDVGLPIVGGVVPAVPRTRSYQSPFDRSEQGIFRARVDFQTPIGANGTLRDKLYYTDLDWDTDGTLLNAAFPGFAGDFVIVRSITFLQDRQKLFGNQLEASWNLSTGSARHNLLVGAELSQLSDDYTLDVGLLPVIGLFNPVETATKPVFLIPGQSLGADSRALVFAPYLADQISFGDKLQLLAGMRFDVLDYEDEITRTDRHSDQWSPMLGVLFSPAPRLSLYANFGKAFSPPSSLVVGERRPESTRQYEGGLKTRFLDGKALASAAVFHIEKENVAIPDGTGVTRQLGTQRSKGVEVELQSELRPGWFVFTSYAWTDAVLTNFNELVTFSVNPPLFAIFDRSGNRMPFAPRNLFNLWTEHTWKQGFSVSAGARYTCTQFIAEDNAFKIPESWVFDAGVSYKRDRARLQVNMKNLTGEKYYTRGFSNSAVIPANPFGIYASLQLSLGKQP